MTDNKLPEGEARLVFREDDEEHERVREKMEAQYPEIREALAKDLGGNPEDYLQRDE